MSGDAPAAAGEAAGALGADAPRFVEVFHRVHDVIERRWGIPVVIAAMTDRKLSPKTEHY